MKKRHSILTLASLVLLTCCNSKAENKMEKFEKGTFGYDLEFLSKRDSIILLKNNTGAQIIVSPKYQAKVFTSTVSGKNGVSLGFVKYDAFDYDTPNEHMNAFGGENRFWLGPEGGQYSVYFKPGSKQIYDNWHTPAPIDIEPWDLRQATETKVSLIKDMSVENYKGTRLKLRVNRDIELFDNKQIENKLGITIDTEVKAVGYMTGNEIVNKSDFEWTEETGTVCSWILDMFIPSPKAITVVPYNEGAEEELGAIATTDYFGEIPSDRLKIKDGILYLKTDGKFRSKMGMNARRTKSIAGNYDPDSKRLTITTFDVEKDAVYLNQEWNPEKNPLMGDAMNAYNDGPVDDGSIMGPFLEIESTSPAAFLKPGESQRHIHNVFHFIGDVEKLNTIAEKLLGLKLETLESIF